MSVILPGKIMAVDSRGITAFAQYTDIQKLADIHEYDKAGVERNRESIHHLGQKVQPLCREHQYP